MIEPRTYTCPICGKRYLVQSPGQWGYYYDRLMVCSYRCMREAEKQEGALLSYRLTQEKKDKIIELHRYGRNFTQISKSLGISQPTVASICKSWDEAHPAEPEPEVIPAPEAAAPEVPAPAADPEPAPVPAASTGNSIDLFYGLGVFLSAAHIDNDGAAALMEMATAAGLQLPDLVGRILTNAIEGYRARLRELMTAAALEQLQPVRVDNLKKSTNSEEAAS